MSTVAELDEQLKEVDRELGMRRRLYPGWISKGTLKQATADKQIRLMEAVRETVREARQAALMTGMGGQRIVDDEPQQSALDYSRDPTK